MTITVAVPAATREVGVAGADEVGGDVAQGIQAEQSDRGEQCQQGPEPSGVAAEGQHGCGEQGGQQQRYAGLRKEDAPLA
ncbi:hypothetical protein [Micromonospora sp. NPDC047730]|uniref:hypothetical protein n=1 Tax=Micromonospora sp. NPDC047730 TaxID=3364253 RepID=UPI003714D9C4